MRQIPTLLEVAGILLVAGGVALHKESEALPKIRRKDNWPVEPEHLDDDERSCEIIRQTLDFIRTHLSQGALL